jgi:hypothetical protein
VTPSVPMPVALRPDLVLVALPPRERTTTAAGVVVLPAPTIMVDRTGIVLMRGAAVRDVAHDDHVLFGSDVGEEVRVGGWPCLLLRETDLDAILPR